MIGKSANRSKFEFWKCVTKYTLSHKCMLIQVGKTWQNNVNIYTLSKYTKIICYLYSQYLEWKTSGFMTSCLKLCALNKLPTFKIGFQSFHLESLGLALLSRETHVKEKKKNRIDM